MVLNSANDEIPFLQLRNISITLINLQSADLLLLRADGSLLAQQPFTVMGSRRVELWSVQ